MALLVFVGSRTLPLAPEEHNAYFWANSRMQVSLLVNRAIHCTAFQFRPHNLVSKQWCPILMQCKAPKGATRCTHDYTKYSLVLFHNLEFLGRDLDCCAWGYSLLKCNRCSNTFGLVVGLFGTDLCPLPPKFKLNRQCHGRRLQVWVCRMRRSELKFWKMLGHGKAQ